MEPNRWQRLQILFEQALAHPPGERAAFLASAEPDAQLRHEVQALLNADPGTGGGAIDGLVQRVAVHAVAAPPATGLRVGAWQLLDEIGAGGMGTVFRAERADGAYQRVVAIKFLHGIPTRDGAMRLQRERQILADLDHPHIAGLIDGGSTEQGQPYLVMDYVEGVAITDYARDCDVDQRLRLIQRLARALHFAHRHLVIHRDLKPANVLVRADATPMLLDFGIAKLLDADAGDQAGHTRGCFTPGYASPEQRRGEMVSTASDIYALGQLMAEVLGGQFVAPDADGCVVPPSARGLSGLPRARLRELDAMVLHACAPQPAQRYPSAESLADDIERYFRNQPLRAAPARPWYLLGKFAHRHRYAVAALALFVIAMMAFTGRLAAERDRAVRAEALAQDNANTAGQVVEYLVSLFQRAAPEEAGNQPIPPGELIDRGRARIADQLAGQPRQQARLLGVLGRIDRELGRSEQAVDSLRAAIALEHAHGTPRQAALYLVDVGLLENQNERPAAAAEALEQALELLAGQTDTGASRVAALGGLAVARLRLGDSEPAGASAAEALQLAVQLDGGHGDLSVDALQALAEVDGHSGHGDSAIAAASEALAIVRSRRPADPARVSAAIGYLANAYVELDRHAEAEPLFREMLDLRLATLDPGSAWVVTARNNLAHAIFSQGRLLDALGPMQANVDLLRARGEDDTPSYLIAINNLASLHEATGNYARSIALFQELYGKASRPQADGAVDARLAQYRQNLGRSLLLAGRLHDAQPHLRAQIEVGPDPDRTAVERGRQLLHLAEWQRRSGHAQQVEPLLVQAEAVFGRVFAADHPRFAAVARVRAALAVDLGRFAEAESGLRVALAIYEGATGPDSSVSIETRIQLAGVLASHGQRAEARRLYDASQPRIDALFVAEAPLHDQLRQLRASLARDPR